MNITRVETRPVVVTLAQPIGSALGQIHSFGCILTFVHDDAGGVGENLVFTLNNRRTAVLRPHRGLLGAGVEGHQFSRPQRRAGGRHRGP